MEELTMRVQGMAKDFVFDVNQFRPMVSSFTINSASAGGKSAGKAMGKRSKKSRATSVVGGAKKSVSGAVGGAMNMMGGAMTKGLGAGGMAAGEARRKKTGKTSITQIPGMPGVLQQPQDADSGGGGASPSPGGSRIRRKKTRVD
jgi:hypothetical protein